ncbi:hypothetical protein ACFX2A_010091 [Malus domestica]
MIHSPGRCGMLQGPRRTPTPATLRAGSAQDSISSMEGGSLFHSRHDRNPAGFVNARLCSTIESSSKFRLFA